MLRIHYVAYADLGRLQVSVFVRRADGLVVLHVPDESRWRHISTFARDPASSSLRFASLQLVTGAYFAEVHFLNDSDSLGLTGGGRQSPWFSVSGAGPQLRGRPRRLRAGRATGPTNPRRWKTWRLTHDPADLAEFLRARNLLREWIARTLAGPLPAVSARVAVGVHSARRAGRHPDGGVHASGAGRHRRNAVRRVRLSGDDVLGIAGRRR